MVTNDVGQIALKYLSPVPKFISANGGGEYIFSVRANISLAWIEPKDVNNILGIKSGCNCGSGKKRVFVYANEDDVRRWTNGGGR